ncbi:MAG: DUF4382 domain-containing protein [Candidatus Micrarchaeia archaeon]
MNKIEVAAGVILILIAVGLLIYLSPSKVGFAANASIPAAKASVLTFQLTDPPEVPNGTQALVIGYSSLSAHLIYANGTSNWVSAEGSGSINLLSLVNMSQVIGKANVPSNSVVDMVRFNITNAMITIGNNTYNVTVPSKQITVHVANAQKVNGTSSAVIDITPTIATIYTNTSTIFVLVPSLRAVVVSGGAQSAIGAKAPINMSMRHELELAKPNITISQIALSQKDNSTFFSLKISNNGNKSVEIMHVMLFGNESININASAQWRVEIKNGLVNIKRLGSQQSNMQIPQGMTNGMGGSANIGSISAEISNALGPNFTLKEASKYMGKGMLENISEELGINLNATMNETNITEIMDKVHSLNVSEEELHKLFSNESNPAFNAIISNFGLKKSEEVLNVSMDAEHFRVINFLVSQNGTLVLPFEEMNENIEESMHEFSEGYVLGAHSSVVLSYNGPISFAHGHVRIGVIPGESYKVVVVGDEGARASANITAS